MPRAEQTEITAPEHPLGSELEIRVFRALLQQRTPLKLRRIVQCHGVFADGWVETEAGRKIPIEIKTTLGWPQLTSACFQLVSLKSKLKMSATEAWIIYARISPEWLSRKKVKGLAHANDCIASFQVGMAFKFIELSPSGAFTTTGGTSAALVATSQPHAKSAA